MAFKNFFIGPQLFLGTHHAGAAVIIGSEGQWPGVKLLIVFFQKSCCSMSGDVKIKAFINHIIDDHKVPAGGSRKLP